METMETAHIHCLQRNAQDISLCNLEQTKIIAIYSTTYKRNDGVMKMSTSQVTLRFCKLMQFLVNRYDNEM